MPTVDLLPQFWKEESERRPWSIFWQAGFLVSVPVFVEAPLVRQFPWLSLALSLLWFGLSYRLLKDPSVQQRGDLLLGFSWTWLAGSIYWGWLRWEPLAHLPVEAIALPFAIWGIVRGRGLAGNWFYLGSLLGTAATDAYFYLTDLIGHWRQIMVVDPELVPPILHDALTHVHTPWGLSCAGVLAIALLAIGGRSLRLPQPHHWAFGGAVLFTLLVDGLFWLSANLA